MSADPVIDIAAIARWGQEAGIHALMTSRWGWPVAECFHFIGLCLLFATVGAFDLRMLGVARGIELRALHRLVPFGIAGFAISVITGLLFVTTAPDQYLHNPAFITKLSMMLLAGINMGLFYASAARGVWMTRAGHLPAVRARIFGAVSLLCWLAVITCGRVITAFRPPAFYWCPWC
jgi:hypothetical protein